MYKIFPWKRFWCSRTGTISLNDNGFFLDPESEYAHFYHKDVEAFENIQKTSCLILLGEPGVGKTTTLNSEIKILSDQLVGKTDVLFHKNLNEYGDESRLIREIFESTIILEWLKGQYHLHLFLDSLDECLLEIPKLAAIFRNQSHKIKDHASRLSLRISCRTGDWPETLTNEFYAIWGKENVRTYELTPLRRKDVFEAAQTLGLDANCFIEAIEKKEIQSLAGNPITLNFLLEEFKNTQEFPGSKGELYLRGCEHLCTENNPDRESAQRTGSLSPTRRLALASRLAAVMIFCNRSSILTKSNVSDLDETNLTLSMLQEGEETTGSYTFSFTERDMRETVKQTALFSGRGPNRFGFAHQSYAEFLAARYLALHQLSIQQIKSLIQLSNDPDQMVIPQLKETTAWLNSIVPEMAQETIKIDPQSMLSGDIESMESRFRRDLVESLLKQFEQQKISDGDWGRYSQYQKLKHPKLAFQLKPYIEDKTKDLLVRRVAIDIAEACEIKELQELLADIALDNSDVLHIREQAAHAVAQIADESTRLRLKPLALEDQPEDKDDGLKGSALRALWPNHLSAQEIFDTLTLPKRSNLYGSYAAFLMDFPKQLKTEDLPSALKWVKKNPGGRGGTLRRYESLSENILFRSWQYLNRAEILDAYAEAIIPRLENYDSICPVPQTGVDDKTIPDLLLETRHNLIRAVISKIQTYRNYLLSSVIDRPQILFDDDLRWLIEELNAEMDQGRKKIWVEVIHDIYRIDRADHTNLILQAMQESQPLAEKFKNTFETVSLDSESAQEMRSRYDKHKKLEEKHKQRKSEQKKKITPSVYERIKTCLDRFKSGDSRAWWQMCLEMTLEDTSKFYGDEFNSDLLALPGWKVCDSNLIERIIKAGKKYILENDAAADRWLGTNTYHRPAMAGYKAFVLLKKLEPNFLNTLRVDIWKKWAAVIIGYHESAGIAGRDKIFLELIKQTYQQVPQEIIDALLVLIDKENAEHDNLFITRKIEDCLDAKLQDALLTKAKDVSLQPGCFQNLLSLLIKANNLKAIDYAKSFLALPFKGNNELRKKAKAAALSLVTQAEDAGWDTVWAAIQADTNFGQNVLLSLSDSFRSLNTKSFPDRIGEKQTADLFIWLSKHFSREKDPKEEGAHWVGPRESLANYRDNLLNFLKHKGSQEAIKAIEHIKNKIPDLDFLNFYLIGARENLRRKNWSPLYPDDFLLLTKNSLFRLILNADHLLDALIESLMRFEKKLQGETPNAIFLWNSLPKVKKLRPKSENDFSDFIKTHLSEDLKQSGIISLREVEIRRSQGKGGSPGERTDIYVKGFIPSSQEHVHVIIEVKGCWHKDVQTAMEKQLLNRYLNESGCDYGIYLVGWYSCNQWDGRDSKKNRISVQNIEEARSKFDDQAKKLSSDKKTIKSFVLNCALR